MTKLSNATTTNIFTKARRKLLTTTMLTAAGLMALAPNAKAMDDFTTPDGENVVGGSATFDRPELGLLNINQSTDRVVINWNHFNIGSKGKTEFFQPGKGSLAVNRVTGGNPDGSKILGTLKANGRVMVIDRNGVFFGENSVVDVGGVIASTGDLTDADALDGDNLFEFANFGNGKIELNGTVNVAEAGLAAFVSPFVSNSGVINAKVGTVAFAGGEKVTLDLYGDGLMEVAVSGEAADALLENTGVISAEGGQVLMTANAAKNAVDNVINMSGVVNVSSVEVQGGKIVLKGGSKGAVNVSGTLEASGTTGGTVNVTGQNVYVADTSVTNVSGGMGADGVGDAGSAEFIAADHADFRGFILGRGGVNGGNGAFAEVSGYGALGYSGAADLFAANGNLGTLLLDPAFAVIHSGLVNNPLGFSYILASWALANSMENANVVVQADDFIDVGTQNAAYNTGNAMVDLALNTLVGTGDIDLSTYDYNTLELAGFKTTKIGFFTIKTPILNLVNHTGTTNGSITFDSDVVNVNKDVIMGNGGVTVDADTLNLDGRFYDFDGVTKLGDARLTGVSKLATINVVSPNALINQAINFADDATDTTYINVGEGTYAESVNLNEANVVLKGSANHKSVITPNSPGVLVTANNTVVDGFDILGGNIGVHVQGADNVQVTNNLIHGQRDPLATGTQTGTPGSGDGILVTRTKASIVDNLYISGNKIWDTDDESIQIETGNNITIISNLLDNRETGVGGVANGQTAIYASLLTGTNTFVGNEIYSGWDAGIHVSQSRGLTINGNVIIGRGTGSGDYGVRVQNSDGTSKTTFVKVLGNVITDTGSDGVFVDNSDYTLVQGNLISKAGRDGVRVIDSKASSILGNIIVTPVGDGVFVDPSPFTIVDGNIISGGVNGVQINDSDDSQVNNNSIYGQSANGVLVTNGSDRVKVYNNTITESGDTVTGIMIDGGLDHVVDDNETIGGTVGIHVKAADGVKVINNYVHGQRNALATGFKTALPGTGDGILVTAKSGDLADNLLIQNNKVEDTDDESIHVQGASNITIVDNFLDNRETGPVDGVANGNNAIYAALLRGTNTIARNTIYSGWETGIYLSEVRGTTVGGATDAEANYIYGRGAVSPNTDVGIFVQNSNGKGVAEVKVLNNFVDGTGRDSVQIRNSDYVLVDDNTLTNARRNGIRIVDSDYVTASNNTINTTGSDGILVDPSNYATVTKNTINFAAGHAINIDESDYATVTYNIIGNLDNGAFGSGSGDGVHVANGSDNAFVDGNTITTDGRGVSLLGGNAHEVSNNTITTISWVNANDEGVYAENTTNANIHDNTVSTADNDGIEVNGGSNATVNKNAVNAATQHGIYVHDAATVAVTNNTVSNTGFDGIHAHTVSGLNIDGNVVFNTTGDGIEVNTSGGALVKNNFIGWTDAGVTKGAVGNIGGNGVSVIDSAGVTVNSNNITQVVGNGIFVDPSPATIVQGNVINGVGLSGVVILDSDNSVVGGLGVGEGNTIDNVGDDGVDVNNSDNVQVKGNLIGTLGGDGNIPNDGVTVSNSDGADIEGNTIVADGSGVSLYGGDAHEVSNNTITTYAYINSFDEGIYAENTTNANIHDNTVTSADNDGIEINGGSDVTVNKNTVNAATEHGIYLHGVTTADVTSNTVSNTGFDGIHAHTVSGLNIDGNIVFNTAGDGIEVNTSSSAKVTKNFVGWTDAGVTPGAASNIAGNGISIIDSASSTVSGNNLIHVVGDGIYVDPSDDTVVDGNVLDYVFGNSIHVDNSDRVKVTNNSIGQTSGGFINPGFGTGDGILVDNGSDNVFVDGNTISTDGRGVSLLGGDGHEVSNNTIVTVSWVNSADEGIYAENTTKANIHHNNVTTADSAGIRVSGGSDATVNENQVHGATEQGIDVLNVTTASVTKNIVENTFSHGISAFNTTGLLISGNFVGWSDAGVTPGALLNIGGDGIHVVDSAAAQIKGNSVTNVAGNGTFVDPSPGTVIDGNVYTNVGLDGIHLLDSIDSFITNNTVNTTGGDGIEVNNSSGTEVGGNTINFAVANGIYVNNSDNVDVTKNTIGNLDNGAFGGGSGDGVLVANGSDNAFVDGNTITTDGRGVSLLGGDGHEVSNNTITTISWVNSADEGIYAESTTNANIHDNTISTADNDGIEVNGGSNATVHKNAVNAATNNGIYVYNVATAAVTDNTVHNTGLDGINAYNTSGLTITGNIVYNTGDDGIDVSESDYAQVNNNYVGYVDAGVTAGGANNIAADGISVVNSDYATANSNKIINVAGNGIFVDPSVYVDVYYNNIQNVGLDGVHAEDAFEIEVRSNYINTTGDDGVDITNSYGADTAYNNIYNTTDDGVVITTSNNTWTYGNSIYYSGGNGVKIDDSDYAQVLSNTVYGSGENGIYIDPSSFDEVANNNVYYSGLNGILVEGGTGHSIYNNYVYGSNYDGIRVWDFGNAYISFNTVDYTGDDGIEAVKGETVWIEGNDVTNAGYWANNADYYGADGIHVRNVNGPLYSGNDYNGSEDNAGNGTGFGPFGSEDDYNVVIIDNNVGVLGMDAEVELAYYDYDGYYDYSVSGAKDDGIEVVGDDWASDDYSYYGTGRTLIAWNNVSNVGVGDSGEYGAEDGYGADGIHVRGVYASYSDYGYPYLFALNVPDDVPAYGPDGFGYSVEIIENTVNNTGDDGIEVLNSGKTLIAGNEVNNTGLGFNDGYYGYYGDGYYSYNSGDGIHVANVRSSDNGYYGSGEGIYGDYGYYSYTHSVEVLNNDVSNTGDDGIEVVYSGRTLIGGNNVSNAGWNSEGYAYGDYYGADGIHVRGVYADEYYDEYDYFANYDVQVIDNNVINSDDDGIEVTYFARKVKRPSFDSLEIVSEDKIPYYDYLATVNVIGNDVDQSGDDGIDVTNANFVLVDENEVTNSGGDGITVNRDGSDYNYYYGKGKALVQDIWYDYGYFQNDVVITDNTVDQSGDDGIEVQGYGQIEVGRNIVTNSGDDGVIVHDLLFGNPYPVFFKALDVEFVEPYLEAYVNIHDNNVDNSGGDGIQVDAYNYFGDVAAGSVVDVTNNVVTDSGANGLYISGPSHGKVYVAGNSFTNNPVGANFESGLIDLTGPGNSFIGGNVGLFFNPYSFGGGFFAPMSLVDDDAPGYETFPSIAFPTNYGGTIGEQFFSGQSQYFVELGNQAFWDFGAGEAIWLNGLNSTYDTGALAGLVRPSLTGGVLSQSVFDFLEERFFHYPDTLNTGIFFFGFVPDPLADIDQKDLFNVFDPFNGGISGLNVTVLGLPNVPGGGGNPLSPAALNAIQTFAGGQQDGTFSPDELNAIETAAGGAEGTTEGGQQQGGSNAPVPCWNDAINAAYNGQVVNYSYATGFEETLAGAAACSATPL